MANLKDKYSQNVEGLYYVDKSCIACGRCVQTAPYNFKFAVGDKHAFVYKQPETPREKVSCLEAFGACPVEAIGNDGAR